MRVLLTNSMSLLFRYSRLLLWVNLDCFPLIFIGCSRVIKYIYSCLCNVSQGVFIDFQLWNYQLCCFEIFISLWLLFCLFRFVFFIIVFTIFIVNWCILVLKILIYRRIQRLILNKCVQCVNFTIIRVMMRYLKNFAHNKLSWVYLRVTHSWRVQHLLFAFSILWYSYNLRFLSYMFKYFSRYSYISHLRILSLLSIA
jgi:hypothetical protein